MSDYYIFPYYFLYGVIDIFIKSVDVLDYAYNTIYNMTLSDVIF